MKTINVATAFDLMVAPGKLQHIPAGLQLVEDYVADHRYTKAHLAAAGVGTQEHVDALWAAAGEAWDKAKETGEAYEAALAEARAAEEEAGVDPRDPPHLDYVRQREGAGFDGDMTAASPPAAVEPEPEDDTQDFEADDNQQTGEVVGLPDGFRWANEEERGGDETYIIEVSTGARIATTADELTQLLALRSSEIVAEVEGAAPAAETAAAPGEARPLDHDGNEEDGGSVAVTFGKEFEEGTDDELRDFIEKRDGVRPHPNAGRATLLKRARKEDAAGE